MVDVILSGVAQGLSAQALAWHFVDMAVSDVQPRRLIGLEQLAVAVQRIDAIVHAVHTFLYGAPLQQGS